MPSKSRKIAKRLTRQQKSRAGKSAATLKGASAIDHDKSLREHLLDLLRGGGAHVNIDQALDDFPVSLCGMKPAGLPFTAWRLLEHMRIAQWDILEFSTNSKYASPDFPEGYWPQGDAPPDETAWGRSLKNFHADLKAMQKLVTDPRTDLHACIPHGTGQTILREALLIADHNAYHLGQVVILRRLFGAWPGTSPFHL